MRNILKKDPISAARDHIARVEAAIVKITTKIDLTEKEVEKHRAARRDHIRADPGAEIPGEIRHGLDIAERMLVANREERAELDAHLRELQDALASARDQAERDAAAAADEALADFVDREFAPAIANATAAIGKACAAYLARMPEGLAVVESRPWSRPAGHFQSNSSCFSREEILAGILAESLFASVPDAFEAQDTARGYTNVLQRLFEIEQAVPQMFVDGALPPAAGNPAKLLLSDRLRARAAAKRAGAPAAIDRAPEPEPAPPVPRSGLKEVEVFATKHFAYQADESAKPRIVGRRWIHNVPSLVADAALAAEVALRTDTREGKDAFEAEKEYRRQSGSTGDRFIQIEDCVDLGDPCDFLDRGDELAAAE